MHTYFVLEKFDISQQSNPLRGNKSKSASLAEKKDYVAKKFSWGVTVVNHSVQKKV